MNEKLVFLNIKQMQFKATPNAAWQDWMHLPPTPKTLEILKRESEASQRLAVKAYLRAKKEKIKKTIPSPHCLFYGERIYGFKFLNESIWNVERGFLDA